jgi:heme-degrading monooxygenase HmoA
MYACATTLKTSLERIDEGIEGYESGLATFREIEGSRGAFLLVDRNSGKGVGVTLWESEDAMRKSREQADRLREQAAGSVDAGVESVNEYEVAVWDV